MDNQKPEAQVYTRQEYATKQFWDSRYKEKQSYFDWYAEFPELKQTFQNQYGLAPQHSVLMLGCGNSKLSQQMYEQGYHNILNIDISPAVIEQMKKISQQKGQNLMKWEVMDATNMHEIKDNTFDAIIDKGTLDALISGKNLDICGKMLKQSMRVLKKDGQFILITYGSPEGRKRLFDSSIGLADYDYYVTKVDLSSMSTLINLMRSNLGNKPLSSITKDAQAMKKSMLQFNLLKVLRRTRKNQKKYVIWPQYQKKDVVFNENEEPQQKSESSKKQQQTTDKKQKQQKTLQQQKQQNGGKQEQKKINYNPKKQSFCYVYSIKPKFGIDIKSVLQNADSSKYIHKVNERGNKQVLGDENLLEIGIYPQNCEQQLQKSIKYLQVSGTANSPLIIYSSLQNLREGKQQIKIVIKQSNRNIIPALAKSIYRIAIKCEGRKMHEIQTNVRTACRQLVQQGQLSVHPSPKTYAYLGILMQKTDPKSRISEFVSKYWYPTYRLLQYTDGTAVYEISVPPTLTQQYCNKILSQSVATAAQQNIRISRQGYLNYYDPRLISLINLCTLTYCDGQTAQLVVQQFQSKFNNYDTPYSTLYLKKQALPLILARFISAL